MEHAEKTRIVRGMLAEKFPEASAETLDKILAWCQATADLLPEVYPNETRFKGLEAGTFFGITTIPIYNLRRDLDK
jgi:hypothetical protein